MSIRYQWFSILLVLTATTWSCGWQGVAGSPETQGDVQEQTTDSKPVADQKKSKSQEERLIDAIDEVIPGEFDKSSDQFKSIQKAVAEFAQNRPAQAETELKKAFNTPEADPPSSLILAVLYFTDGNVPQARALLEKTTIENPQYPSTYAGFARLAIESGRWTDADALLEKLDRAVDSGSWNEVQQRQFRIEWLDGVVDVAIGRKQFDTARGHLKELVELLPEKVNILLRIAEVEFELGNLETSVEYLKKAKQMSPQILQHQLIFFNWYMGRGEKETAGTWIEKAAKEFEGDAQVRLVYARHLLREGNDIQAKIWAQKADEAGADWYATNFLRGQIEFVQRSYGMAEFYFSELHRRRPVDFSVANMYALCLAESENRSKQGQALGLAVNTARLNPRNRVAISTLGWIQYRIGNRKKADQLLGQAASTSPVPPETAFYIAHLLEDDKRFDDAARLLKSCIDSKGFFLYHHRALDRWKSVTDKQKQASAAEENSEKEADNASDKEASGSPDSGGI